MHKNRSSESIFLFTKKVTYSRQICSCNRALKFVPLYLSIGGLSSIFHILKALHLQPISQVQPLHLCGPHISVNFIIFPTLNFPHGQLLSHCSLFLLLQHPLCLYLSVSPLSAVLHTRAVCPRRRWQPHADQDSEPRAGRQRTASWARGQRHAACWECSHARLAYSLSIPHQARPLPSPMVSSIGRASGDFRCMAGNPAVAPRGIAQPPYM
jgi:hypothetical protein